MVSTLKGVLPLQSLVSVHSDVEINIGGYVRVGNIVIVSCKITVKNQLPNTAKIISGFPSTSGGFSLQMSTMRYTYSIRISSGNAYTNQITEASEYWITGAYIIY